MTQATDKLYYDGACSMCNAEMKQLRKRADDQLELIDIHGLSAPQATKDKMLKMLHFETASGETLLGLDANVAAWRHTRWRFLFSWLRLPVISWFADKVYVTWAERRFIRLYKR